MKYISETVKMWAHINHRDGVQEIALEKKLVCRHIMTMDGNGYIENNKSHDFRGFKTREKLYYSAFHSSLS